jgi:NTP pyrophosphatase (non-canonical NTP hydrolase)
MDFNEYQSNAKKTAVYPSSLEGRFYYPALGLAGEAGELCNKIKKIARDNAPIDKEQIKGELGDCLWYISQLATEFGISLDDIGIHNIGKLASRAERGVIKGSGDMR